MNFVKIFNKISKNLNESMAEMQAIGQPAVGAGYQTPNSLNVPAPGYISTGKSLLPTEEQEEIQNLIDDKLNKIKIILSKTNISNKQKLQNIIKITKNTQLNS